jgi:hypothetical protein
VRQGYPDPVERVAWTDEGLDDMPRRMDAGFERLERDISELRIEVRTELREMRTTINRAGGGIVVGLLVAILTNGI